MLQRFLEFKQTNRPWHLPVLAGLCIGIPVMAGYFTNHLQEGKLASMSALVILYIQSFNLATRMITLMACCFIILLSFTIGIVFSFNHIAAPIALGLYVFILHFGLYHLKLTRPPGNFFFIMVASVAICMPFNPQAIPQQIGYIGIGTMISCCLGLIYSFITIKGKDEKVPVIQKALDNHSIITESVTFGFFAGLSLLIANLLKLDNPYWVPTSCAAVMQGVSTTHIFTRSMQRIVGTFIGLGITWCLLLLKPSLFVISISIIVCQVIVEFLVVRNYAIAVIFITILTIFLAEGSSSGLTANINSLFIARFFDILLGSIIGGIGGWVLYNEQIHYHTKQQIIKTKIAIKRRNKNAR